MSKPMDLGIKQAKMTMSKGIGGPFGAAIVNSKTGEIICVDSNHVLGDNDPTAHAEICAIRTACKILNTFDLTGYTLYATGYPCPMCMAAIIWANLDKVIYAGDVKDAEEIGFRDDFIYDFIKGDCKNREVVPVEHDPKSRDKVRELYKEYQETNKEMY